MSSTVTAGYPFVAQTWTIESMIRSRWLETTSARGIPWRPRGRRLALGRSAGGPAMTAPSGLARLGGGSGREQTCPGGGILRAVEGHQHHVHDRRQQLLELSVSAGEHRGIDQLQDRAADCPQQQAGSRIRGVDKRLVADQRGEQPDCLVARIERSGTGRIY